MKFVKKTISLPEDVHQYAEKLARLTAQQRGGKPNVSGIICELLQAKKNELAKLQKAA